MGIKTNNLVVSKKDTDRDNQVNDTQSQEASDDRKLSRTVGNSGAKLVVDGKVKNISKKSAFLLDMLTLDDDQPK